MSHFIKNIHSSDPLMLIQKRNKSFIKTNKLSENIKSSWIIRSPGVTFVRESQAESDPWHLIAYIAPLPALRRCHYNYPSQTPGGWLPFRPVATPDSWRGWSLNRRTTASAGIWRHLIPWEPRWIAQLYLSVASNTSPTSCSCRHPSGTTGCASPYQLQQSYQATSAL